MLIIGGRGKWAGNSVEVLDTTENKWLRAEEGVNFADRAYTGVTMARPWRGIRFPAAESE